MRKHLTDYEAVDLPREPGRRWLRRCSPAAIVVVAMALLAVPLVSELGRLCVANWRGMYGQAGSVDTPVLDQITDLGLGMARAVSRQVRGIFHQLPWKPSMVIGVGLLWALVMMLPLRSKL